MSGPKKNQESNGLSGLVASFFASLTQPLRDRARDSLSGVAPSVRRGLTAGLLKVEPGSAVRIKSRVASLFEGSFFASLPGRIAGYFVSVPSKSVAAFLITFSVVSLIASLFRMNFAGDAFSYFKLALPIIPAAFAIPLLFTDRSLSQLAGGSFFLRTFLTEKIGVGTVKLGRKAERPHSAAVMFILGTLLGLLTY